MVTGAQILSIDLQKGTCEVDMPVFRTANTPQPITATASFSCLPGAYGGYAVGDMVWVAFERGLMEYPVVIGKIYKGPDVESKRGGALVADNIRIDKSMELPRSAVIRGAEPDYGTIDKLIHRIRELEGREASAYEVVIKEGQNEISFRSATGYSENTVGVLASRLNGAGFASAETPMRIAAASGDCVGIYSPDGKSVLGAMRGGGTWTIYSESSEMTAEISRFDVSMI